VSAVYCNPGLARNVHLPQVHLQRSASGGSPLHVCGETLVLLGVPVDAAEMAELLAL